mgnify:FL=1
MTREYDRGAALYAAFLEGDASALEALVQLYGDALTRFAYCIVRDDAAAEDVTADTFAALIVRRKKFREEAKFRTYLYAVARNKAIDRWRRHGRQCSRTGLENVLVGENGEQGLFAAERSRVLYTGMQQLPAQYQEVLYLSYFDGFSVSEIGRVLKKSAKQVYNLLSRARSALKQILIKEGYSHEDL